MARPVLVLARLLAAALLLAFSANAEDVSWSQSMPQQCSLAGPESTSASSQEQGGQKQTSQKQISDLRQRVEAGPFYKRMLQQLGKPQSCTVKQEGDSIALSYAFRKSARLDVQANSTIESSQQRAEFPGLNRARAVALLKKGELDSFGKDGCGIDWNKPVDQTMEEPAGSRATVFRGDSCNCQARIVYQGDSVFASVFSSAC